MTYDFDQRLNLLAEPDLLSELEKINRGIEKEGLRANLEGELSKQPHPACLGSALTNPFITTDYSEALLEFITPTLQSPEEVIRFLKDIHHFAYSRLDNELIWVASMPCKLGGEDNIPIARYGSSNSGMLRHIYRVGLAYRYGKTMQTIAGVHYNFSLPESFWPAYQTLLGQQGSISKFQTTQYFSLIRNFRRYSWLLLYLFGASPALCETFLQGRKHELQARKETLYAPYATSLRMGDLGYHNNAQQGLNICYNSLNNYVHTLSNAIKTPHPDYEKIGVLKDGEYRQLNTSILQIENEYYSDIRPKRVAGSGVKPIKVLAKEGVEYIEVRNLDLNPFIPAGISTEQVRFMDCFLLFCLLEDSPNVEDDECQNLQENKQKVVNRGREPGLKLTNQHQEVSLQDWANQLFGKISMVAQIMDKAHGGKNFSASVERQKEKLVDVDNTPSAQTLAAMNEKSQSFFEFGLEQSSQQRKYFIDYQTTPERMKHFADAARNSLDRQKEMEASDSIPFAEFLANYVNA